MCRWLLLVKWTTWFKQILLTSPDCSIHKVNSRMIACDAFPLIFGNCSGFSVYPSSRLKPNLVIIIRSEYSRNKHNLTWKYNNAYLSQFVLLLTTQFHSILPKITNSGIHKTLPKLTSVATLCHSHFCIFRYGAYFVHTVCSVISFYIQCSLLHHACP